MRRLSLKARATPRRCALCHDGSGAVLASCPHCRTLYHEECRKALGRCPTLGCAEVDVAEPRVGVEEPQRRTGRNSRLRFWQASLMSLATGALAALAIAWSLSSQNSLANTGVVFALLLHYFFVPAFVIARRTGSLFFTLVGILSGHMVAAMVWAVLLLPGVMAAARIGSDHHLAELYVAGLCLAVHFLEPGVLAWFLTRDGSEGWERP
jgi:hypothetical protein